MFFCFTILIICLPLSSSLHNIILPEGYSPDEKPPGTPLLIQSSLNLRNIISISEIQQQISVETTFRLYWQVRSTIFLSYLQQKRYNWVVRSNFFLGSHKNV